MSTNKAFLGINLDLLENPKYKSLDSRAMMLYALYYDRYSASMNNARLGNTAFVDDMGVFIRFTNDLAAKVLHVSKQKVTDFRKALSDLDLIKVVREGLKGYKIYVYPVQQTPANVELLLPWKNHTITVQKTVSDWTITSKLEFCKTLKKNSQSIDMTVSRISESTCVQNDVTSLSHSSLSQVFINHNELTDNNAHAKSENKPKSSYQSFPSAIKSNFNTVFGFITPVIADQLHTLLESNQEDMICYAIETGKHRRISSPIAYIKTVLVNAVKAGAKCVQDMIDQTRNFKNQHHYSKHKRFAKHGTFDEKAALAKLSKTNPKKYQQLLDQRRKQQELASREIPIFKLSDVFA